MAKPPAKKKPTHKRVLKAARLRLMPLTMAMLSLLLLVKVNELYIGSRQLGEILSVRDAQASAKKEEPEHKEEEKEEAKDEGEHKDEAKKDEEHDEKKDEEHAAADEGHKDDAKKEEHGEGEAKEEGGHGGGHGEAKPAEEPKTYGAGKLTVKQVEELKAKERQQPYTQTELDLLQNLTKRREELDQRAKDLELKTSVMDATEKRINDKIGEMKALQTELAKVVAEYKQQQNTEVMSLVKIYENMKPTDAANIFNEMDMPILLEVIGRMSERKVAPVLAGMDPKKARDVTQELAELRKNRKPMDAAANQAIQQP